MDQADREIVEKVFSQMHCQNCGAGAVHFDAKSEKIHRGRLRDGTLVIRLMQWIVCSWCGNEARRACLIPCDDSEYDFST